MVLSHASSSWDDPVHCTFASRYVREDLPPFRISERSIPREAAYQIINDELMLDGNPRLNPASFVTTWMEPECDKLIMGSINKNYVDMDEYPVTTDLQMAKLYAGEAPNLNEKDSQPYKWAQHLAGIDFLPEMPLSVGNDSNRALRSADLSSPLALYRQQNRAETFAENPLAESCTTL